jgi:hypothetical protein
MMVRQESTLYANLEEEAKRTMPPRQLAKELDN